LADAGGGHFAPRETSMKIASIIFFVLTFVTGFSGTRQAAAALSQQSGQDSSYLMGYVIGSFLVPAICLIVALVLWKKANRKSSAAE
jgi:hypothetical protein